MTGEMTAQKFKEIFQRLSHPFPAVLIDRVQEVEKSMRIRTTKAVSANEFFLAGHFPGNPIMPGVLTLEGLTQSALLLIDESHHRGKLTVFLERVDRVRFKKAIIPGDRAEFSVAVTKKEEGRWRCHGTVEVNRETVAEADMIFKVEFREVGFEI